MHFNDSLKLEKLQTLLLTIIITHILFNVLKKLTLTKKVYNVFSEENLHMIRVEHSISLVEWLTL